MSDRDERGTSERPSEQSKAVSDRDERGTSERPSEQSKAVTDDQPALRILTADATDEEVAALVAVFAALGPAGGPAPDGPAPGVERTAPPGPGRPPARSGRLARQRPPALTYQRAV